MRPVLALILVFLAAACGGNETAGPDKTFQGDGYSFSYPGDWEERESDAEPGSADVVIAPEPGVTGISVGVFDSPQEVTAENIDDLMGEIRTGAETFLAQNVEGSTLDGDVEQVTIAGLPAVTFAGTTTAGQGNPHARRGSSTGRTSTRSTARRRRATRTRSTRPATSCSSRSRSVR